MRPNRTVGPRRRAFVLHYQTDVRIRLKQTRSPGAGGGGVTRRKRRSPMFSAGWRSRGVARSARAGAASGFSTAMSARDRRRGGVCRSAMIRAASSRQAMPNGRFCDRGAAAVQDRPAHRQPRHTVTVNPLRARPANLSALQIAHHFGFALLWRFMRQCRGLACGRAVPARVPGLIGPNRQIAEESHPSTV
jgi:hypothetical protein